MDKWKCGRCNFVFALRENPRVCPNCTQKSDFELFNEQTPPFIPWYDE